MTPQETVERALALSKADGCVVIATERSEANLRWASNTLTTNGSMRSREVAVISVVDGGRHGRGRGAAQRGDRGRRWRTWSGRASRPPATPAPPRTPRRWSSRTAHRPAGTSRPAETSIGRLRDGRARAWARRSPGRPAQRAAAVRLRRARAGDPLPRLLHRPAAAARAADRPDRHQRQVAGLQPLGLGRPGLARTSPTSTSTALDAELGRRLDWAERSVELPAGRYETLLPPSAVADLILYLYGSRPAARDADEGRTVFSKPGGGNRIGERLSTLPLTLRSDPAAPGLECAPFLAATAVGRRARSRSSTTACRSGATEWIRDGVLTELIRTRAYATKTGTQPRAVRRQPAARGAGRDRVDRRDGRPDRARAAADLRLVHPGGRPADPAADRPHPRRGLPGRGRRGHRRGEQLPLERVAGRPARPASPRPGRPSAACRASGATTSPAPRCRPCGCPTST